MEEQFFDYTKPLQYWNKDSQPKKGKKFQDPNFPPNENSLIGKDANGEFIDKIDGLMDEFNSLLKYINKNHSFKQLEGKMIKYVSPTIDLRTGSIGCIKLDDKIFSQTNENRHRNLKEWIMQYLKED